MNMEILLTIMGLAVLDTLSPTIIGVTLYLLVMEKKRLIRLLSVYLITIAILYFFLGFSLMFGITLSFDFYKELFKHQILSWAIFLIGMIMFIVSFYMPKKKATIPSVPSKKNTFTMFLLGFTTFLIEGGTAFPYFAAIGLMSTSNLTLLEWTSILGIYNIIMVLPSIILMVMYTLFGRWLHQPFRKLNDRLSKSKDSALSWVMCIVGIVLIFASLDYL
ncbi:GAP family protein [Psychrobacillus sp. FSL K6-2684]|uniref:GAP family protein n=1 Tax=Psychrobacillus sp. FSL K6-2684 TaxID=2921547 RepID=UPI0030F97C40